MKGVFDISGASRYDDAIAERYHFPRDYLSDVKKLVGDWVAFRETRAEGGRMAYIAVAFVERVDADPVTPNHYYARISNFLDFDRPVRFRDEEGRYFERVLRDLPQVRDVGRTLHGNSVRVLEDGDFAAIVQAGLNDILAPENRIRLELGPSDIDEATRELLAGDLGARRIEQLLVNRKVRDASFRNHVLAAYENSCAVTGLKIINGGGRAEAQAAHIWSVADGGPDIVQNGLALSATAHWLFDRYLISLDDNFCLLVSHNKVPSELARLFPPIGQKIRLPKLESLHPRADFVSRHRERLASV